MNFFAELNFTENGVRPVKETYRNVEDNKIHFTGKTGTQVKYGETKSTLSLLVTRKQANVYWGWIRWRDPKNYKNSADRQDKIQLIGMQKEDNDVRPIKKTFSLWQNLQQTISN